MSRTKEQFHKEIEAGQRLNQEQAKSIAALNETIAQIKFLTDRYEEVLVTQKRIEQKIDTLSIRMIGEEVVPT